MSPLQDHVFKFDSFLIRGKPHDERIVHKSYAQTEFTFTTLKGEVI